MIEIKLTSETVAEAQAEMLALLKGYGPVATTPSGSEPTSDEFGNSAPSTPTSPTRSTSGLIPDTNPPSESSTTAPSNGSAPEPETTTTSEQPKRRGRPKKTEIALGNVAGSTTETESASFAAVPETATTTVVDEGNAPETGATEPVEPTSDAASSTSSETATAQEAPGEPAPSAGGQQPTASSVEATTASPGATTPTASLSEELPPVTDTELQTYCAKLATHFGGPQKIFDACKPFLAEGDVPRPTNIKSVADRWAFIRQMEAETGKKFHG